MRSENRKSDQIRSLTIEPGVNRYAEGSVLIRAGYTEVLCTASVQSSVPDWLVGSGKGWITAEYSMLPRATHTRSKRDREKVSGRTQEIQRLIGRALRSAVNMKALGEVSVMIDCDVLQADGGTRTASITGGCVALALALQKKFPALWPSPAWNHMVCALSLGVKKGEILVDLDYDEDSTCDVDMNFVMAGPGSIIEIQGTAEGAPFTPPQLSQMIETAIGAGRVIQQKQLDVLRKCGVAL